MQAGRTGCRGNDQIVVGRRSRGRAWTNRYADHLKSSVSVPLFSSSVLNLYLAFSKTHCLDIPRFSSRPRHVARQAIAGVHEGAQTRGRSQWRRKHFHRAAGLFFAPVEEMGGYSVACLHCFLFLPNGILILDL